MRQQPFHRRFPEEHVGLACLSHETEAGVDPQDTDSVVDWVLRQSPLAMERITIDSAAAQTLRIWRTWCAPFARETAAGLEQEQAEAFITTQFRLADLVSGELAARFDFIMAPIQSGTGPAQLMNPFRWTDSVQSIDSMTALAELIAGQAADDLDMQQARIKLWLMQLLNSSRYEMMARRSGDPDRLINNVSHALLGHPMEETRRRMESPDGTLSRSEIRIFRFPFSTSEPEDGAAARDIPNRPLADGEAVLENELPMHFTWFDVPGLPDVEISIIEKKLFSIDAPPDNEQARMTKTLVNMVLEMLESDNSDPTIALNEETRFRVLVRSRSGGADETARLKLWQHLVRRSFDRNPETRSETVAFLPSDIRVPSGEPEQQALTKQHSAARRPGWRMRLLIHGTAYPMEFLTPTDYAGLLFSPDTDYAQYLGRKLYTIAELLYPVKTDGLMPPSLDHSIEALSSRATQAAIWAGHFVSTRRAQIREITAQSDTGAVPDQAEAASLDQALLQQLTDWYLQRMPSAEPVVWIPRFDPSAIFPAKTDSVFRLRDGYLEAGEDGEGDLFRVPEQYQSAKPLGELQRRDSRLFRRIRQFMPEHAPNIVYHEELIKSIFQADSWEAAVAELAQLNSRRKEPDKPYTEAEIARRADYEQRLRQALAEITGMNNEDIRPERLISEAIQMINSINGGRDTIPQEFKNGRIKDILPLLEYLFASKREHSRHSALSILYTMLISLQRQSELRNIEVNGRNPLATENFYRWTSALEEIFVEHEDEKILLNTTYLVLNREGIAVRAYESAHEARRSLHRFGGEQVIPYKNEVRLVRSAEGGLIPVIYTEREKKSMDAKMMIKQVLEATPRGGAGNVSGDFLGNMVVCRSASEFQQIFAQIMSSFGEQGIDIQFRDVEYFGAGNTRSVADEKPRMLKLIFNGRGTHEIIFFLSWEDYYNYRNHPVHGHGKYKAASSSNLSWLKPEAVPLDEEVLQARRDN